MTRQTTFKLAFSAGLLSAGFSAGGCLAKLPLDPAAGPSHATPASAPAPAPSKLAQRSPSELRNGLVGLEESLDCAKRISDAFEALSEEVSPAVVSVTSHVRGFGSSVRQLAQGSGVVIRRDGMIATNNHVVDGGETFQASFTDGRVLNAALIGRDPDSDLAFLQLDEGEFAALPIANREARVGEFVLAVGNPLGLGHTVSSGIVSALGRQNLNIAVYEDFIQTNAEINPGNSGGPLINLEGEVLGINTAIGIGNNGPQGISFAIPTDMVQTVLKDIVKYGHVKRGFLGVQTRDYYATARRSRRTPSSGAIIRIVTPDTPAERVGMRAGDIVLEISGHKIRSSNDLLKRIATFKPGAKIDILLERDGRKRTLSPVLIQREFDAND